MKLPLPDINDDGSYSFTAGLSVDADGSPHAYNQPPNKGLDYIENAGHRGNWWGLACNHNGDPYVQGAHGSNGASGSKEIPLELLQVGKQAFLGIHRPALMIGNAAKNCPVADDLFPLLHFDRAKPRQIRPPDIFVTCAG